jgi:Na+/H+ antiporter NhaD/arsenite permease-like protein
VAIFVMVYIGMVLGGLPRLKLDRSGVALLGAIAVIGLGAMSTEEAARAVDLPTVLLLFSFMVVSAQMRLGGFYTAVTRRVAALPLGRNALLGAIIAVAGALSAVFSNDIICLALKGLSVAAALLLVFLFTHWPREVAALVGAGVLLLSRRLHSSQVMGFVDWPLLVLFMGLFVVNHAFESTGLAAQAVALLGAVACTWQTTARCLWPASGCPTWSPTCQR